MAAGLPVLAFDTLYYRSLLEKTGAVDLVPWPSVEALALRIEHFMRYREQLTELTLRTRQVALTNTAEIWLEKRWSSILELFEKEPAEN